MDSETYRAIQRLATVQAAATLAVQARAAPAREAAVADNALTHGQELPGLAASGERMVLILVLVSDLAAMPHTLQQNVIWNS